MFGVLLLRVFKKQHERYPWEASMSNEEGVESSLEGMQAWEEVVQQVPS